MMTMEKIFGYGMLAAMLFVGSPVGAQSLNDLDIQVVLQKNGDAQITETRQMTITGKGTDCFIGLGNMGASEVKDLSVSDETGQQYENLGTKWDVGASRAKKTGRCGVVKKSHGVTELCWGIGDSGERTYVTSYTITGLVRGYKEADAIRHVFLDETVQPKPKHAKLTISSADPSVVYTPENCGVWGFRFEGDLRFENGKMVAETLKPMDLKSAMYVMAKFPKGMMQPAITEDDTFEHKKQLALEGSDYGDAIQGFSLFELIWKALAALGILGALAALVYGIIRLVKKGSTKAKRLKHEQWEKSVDYFRDIPLEGNLQAANDMLNAFHYDDQQRDYNHLLQALVLQLVNAGAFTVDPVADENGEMQQRFVVQEMPMNVSLPPVAYKLHDIFKKAAGENSVLDPTELESFMDDKANAKQMRTFLDLLWTKRDPKYYKGREDEQREVYGFKRFLNDFTLVGERSLKETSLWNDYLVWATLFGNAEQVEKDMRQANPEFFKMDQANVRQSTGAPQSGEAVKAISNVLLIREGIMRKRMLENQARRENKQRGRLRGHGGRGTGRGGRSSRGGGGGGFSGGGGGGGIR